MTRTAASAAPATGPISVIGQGKMGTALSAALRAADFSVSGPYGRGAIAPSSEIVFLCVPDDQIGELASTLPNDQLLAHCSGALTLAALGDHDGFSIHPLLAVSPQTTDFRGVACAIAAKSAKSTALCDQVSAALGVRAFTVSDADRPLYHAAASVAGNYVVTVAAFAEELFAQTGVDRSYFAPLVRAAIDNWSRAGAAAMTGPVARGDDRTVALHRQAIAEHAPDRLGVWQALTDATYALTELTKRSQPGEHPGESTESR